MKKTLYIVIAVLFFLGGTLPLFAQWQIYDGSVLPPNNNPAFAETNTKDPPDNPGTIVDDPDFVNNKLLQFISEKTTASKFMWGIDWNMDPATGATIVCRVKALDVSTYDRTFEVEFRDGVLRDKLFVKSNGELEIDKADIKRDLPNGADAWHTYRITYQSGKTTVYLDEAPIPYMVGTSTSGEDDNDVRFGDGSDGNTYAFLMDWMIWDVSGVYPPGQGNAIPEGLLIDLPIDMGNIVFVSRPDKIDPATGENADKPHIDDLEAAGYDVTTFYHTTLSTASQAQLDTLNNADLVIIGRSTASGIFGGAHKLAWNRVMAPMIALHPYVVRNNRMNWFNTGSCTHHNDAGVILNATIDAPDDPVFDGLDPSVGPVPWAVAPFDVVQITEGGNGTILASSSDDETVLFVRFDPWVEFYPGAIDRPAGYRTLFGNGNDDTSDPTTGDKIYNYNNFTPESKMVYFAEIARLIALERVQKPQKNIVFVSRPDKIDPATGENADKPHIDDLLAAGYDVTTFYHTTLSTATQAQLDTLNNADLVIIGRSTASGIFGGAHKMAWNRVTAPMIALHPYVVRNNRMNWFDTGSCTHHNDAGVVLNATIDAPMDDVFAGLDVSGGTLPWAVGPLDVVEIYDAGNGTLIASSEDDQTVLFARFDPWVEFYPGANDRPAGYRTLIGNGNDDTSDPTTGDKIYNYNNFTTESKQVYLAEVERLAFLSKIPQPQRDIVFVSRPDKIDPATGENADKPHIDDLVAAGYNVTTFYHTTLSTATQAQLDTLNNADLVIIGRSTASGIFGGAYKYAWNSIKAPMIALHPYVVRNNRMNWFDTGSCTHHNEAGEILDANIDAPMDAVFTGLDVSGGTLPWAVGPYDAVEIKDAGNGEIIASSAEDSVVLFVRFDPWVEFYKGSLDRPAGYRTLIGNGNDDTSDPTTGDKIYNYNNFTTESKQVYLAEVDRMSMLSKDVPKPLAEGNIVFVSRPDKIDDVTGENADQPHIDDLVAEGYDVTTFYHTTLSTATQAQLDTLNNADLVIIGRSTASDIFGAAHKEAWNNVKAPMMALHPYVVRNNRMNWFNTGSCVHYNDAGVVLDANIHMSTDYVFGGMMLTNGTLPWAVGPYDAVDTKEAGNGTLLASSAVDSVVLFVRFDPWVEFYEGSVDMPAGYRTLIGNGNDDTSDPTTGNKIYNYNNFTTESKQVWLKEVERMVGLGTVPPTAVESEISNVPTAYNLYQNYPNPFNPVTHIAFTLARRGHTTLTIYNIRGQVVETLVDQELAAGKHHFSFEAVRYTSGVYFYMLKSGDHVEVKKMMLLK